MLRLLIRSSLLVLLVTTSLCWAQSSAKESSSPVADALRANLERQSANMVAAAEEMPADKFSYSPTPQQMSFGHLVMHIAGSNNFLCSGISGQPEPAESKLTESAGKAKLVQAMKDSFSYCSNSLAKVDDSKLAEKVKFFGGHDVTRARAMMALASDWADHYGAQAMYLRLNGLLPPTAKPAK
ncbi:MAG TPA: DinB family protein [Terriglobales bacterium]|nr:DinB family protein [Terriglobales bacterium]